MTDLESLRNVIAEDYARKVHAFRLLPITGKDIFIGDSMIAFMLMKKYGFESWINMGIAGDTTIGVHERLDAVIRQKPKRVIISIGSNDLVLTNQNNENIVKRIQDVILTFESHQIKVYYLLITPICASCEHANALYIAGRTNDEIEKLNLLIREQISSINLIDTYTPMLDSNRELNAIYSKDGIHLNDLGYQVFTQIIHDVLR